MFRIPACPVAFLCILLQAFPNSNQCKEGRRQKVEEDEGKEPKSCRADGNTSGNGNEDEMEWEIRRGTIDKRAAKFCRLEEDVGDKSEDMTRIASG
ncbi:hypothetical protein WR25_25114 [Diploscapter pachys]|uniref:Uncharacterized protein n=1 Tax=Diploscapter pachys TaxID=2018661 RepID=A0A2A2LC01_9BILA|nr:hypothetical protein WR25_25114 [Diploscapter pachys]